MSRIYDNRSLTNLPVETRHVKSSSTKEFEGKGEGVLLEGFVRHKSRYMMVDERGSKTRYFVFHVEVRRAHRRKFDANGKETTPNFSQTKKVSTGYLMSSYKAVPKGKTDLLDIDKVRELVHVDLLNSITKKTDFKNTIAFWINESLLEQLDIDLGDEVRLTTKGNSAIIEQLLRIESSTKTVGNFVGDETVGSSWTDKVLANKSDQATVQVEGVDDDEWDD